MPPYLFSEPSLSAGPGLPAGRASSLARIKTLVTLAFNVSPEDLQQANRGVARTAFARQCAMYLARVALGYPMKDVAQAFGRDRATVAHACRVVEDNRDDDAIDTLLAALEDQLQTAERLA